MGMGFPQSLGSWEALWTQYCLNAQLTAFSAAPVIHKQPRSCCAWRHLESYGVRGSKSQYRVSSTLFGGYSLRRCWGEYTELTVLRAGQPSCCRLLLHRNCPRMICLSLQAWCFHDQYILSGINLLSTFLKWGTREWPNISTLEKGGQ